MGSYHRIAMNEINGTPDDFDASWYPVVRFAVRAVAREMGLIPEEE